MSNQNTELEPKRTCECRLCVYSRKVDGIIERRNVDELIELVKELMNTNYCIGEDLNYHQCIMDGSWPSAVQQLEKALEKAKNHPNRVAERLEAERWGDKVA